MISKFFFLIILIYIIWAIFFSKEKYHLLLIPSIFDSNFFGFFSYSFGDKGDFVFVTIIALWMFFLSFQQKIFWTKIAMPHVYLILVFLVFLFYVLVESIIKYNEVIPAILVSRRLFRYLVVLFYVSAMFRVGRKGLNKMGELIERITLGLSILYVIQSGLGISIFQVSNYGEYYIQGTAVSRNFAALPYFLMFSIVHVALKEKFAFYNGFAIFIFILTILLSYTRGLVLLGFLLLIVSLFIRALKYSKSFTKLLKLVVVLPLSLLIIIITFSKVFPQKAEYFFSRIENIQNAQSVLTDPNVNLRSNIIKSRIDKVLEVNPISGLGFIHEESQNVLYPDLFIRKHDRRGQVVVGDQSWGNMIALIGFLGTFIFLAMLLFPIFFLLYNHIFIRQDLTLIASSMHLIGVVSVYSLTSPILTDGVFLISFLLALIIAQTNYFVIENSNNSSE